MILLPTFATVIALIVGHPFPATCDPSASLITGHSEWGQTFFDPQTNTAQRIALYSPCGDLGTPYDANDGTQAVALLTAAHEAFHVVLGRDETQVECAALRSLPWLITKTLGPQFGNDTLSRLLTRRAVATITAQAQTSDSLLPAPYHTHPCP